MSIVSEFDQFKDVLFNEKIIRHKMKRILSKKHKLETYQIDKSLCHVLTIKVCIRWWNLYFELFSQVIIIKKIVIIEKDHDYWKTVIIKKDCDRTYSVVRLMRLLSQF